MCSCTAASARRGSPLSTLVHQPLVRVGDLGELGVVVGLGVDDEAATVDGDRGEHVLEQAMVGPCDDEIVQLQVELDQPIDVVSPAAWRIRLGMPASRSRSSGESGCTADRAASPSKLLADVADRDRVLDA